ncbi:MAG: MFS transporter [Planctomycetaceae bacterium]
MSRTLAAIRSVARRYVDLPAAVHVLCFGTFLNRAGSFVLLFLTIYVSEHLKFGVSFATVCVGAFGAGSIVSSLVGGYLADTFGRRRIMLLSMFGGAGMLVLLGQLTERWSFLAAMFGFAMLSELYRPAASAMIGDVVEPLRRPYAFGLLYISVNLGFAFAPPIGGLLAGYSLFQLLFLLDALTAAVFGLVIVFYIRETLPAPDIAATSEPASDTSSPGTAVPDIPATGTRSSEAAMTSGLSHPMSPAWVRSTREILSDTPFVMLCLATLLTTSVFVQAFSTLPMYLRQLGYSETEFGFMISVNGIMIVVLQLPLTHLLSRFNRIAVIMAGELLLAVGFGLTGFASTKSAVIACIIVWTLGEIAQAAFKQSVVSDMSPKEYRGRYMGVFGMCHAVGLTIGAPLGGEIYARHGAQVLWPGCSLVVLASVAIYSIVYAALSRGPVKPVVPEPGVQ